MNFFLSIVYEYYILYYILINESEMLNVCEDVWTMHHSFFEWALGVFFTLSTASISSHAFPCVFWWAVFSKLLKLFHT